MIEIHGPEVKMYCVGRAMGGSKQSSTKVEAPKPA
jgi:hypothetical protein